MAAIEYKWGHISDNDHPINNFKICLSYVFMDNESYESIEEVIWRTVIKESKVLTSI